MSIRFKALAALAAVLLLILAIKTDQQIFSSGIGVTPLRTPPASAELATMDASDWSQAWLDEKTGIRLRTDPDHHGPWICAEIPGQARQPFCRRFQARLVGACQGKGLFKLVLANGDIHVVDRALMGRKYSFAPAHRSPDSVELVEAWLPQQECMPADGISSVFAIDRKGQFRHFNGRRWLTLNGS